MSPFETAKTEAGEAEKQLKRSVKPIDEFKKCRKWMGK
jgi:hypothetical protein